MGEDWAVFLSQGPQGGVKGRLEEVKVAQYGKGWWALGEGSSWA